MNQAGELLTVNPASGEFTYQEAKSSLAPITRIAAGAAH